MKGRQSHYGIDILLSRSAIFCYIVIMILLNGCSKTENDEETKSKAIKGIAFLILDANFNESTAPGTKEGIEYSRYWLQKQQHSLKADLQMRCNILSKLVIDLNMLFLKEMIDESNLPFLLEDSTRQKFEPILEQNPDFYYEWKVFKRDQNNHMKPQIVDYRKQLKENSENKQLIINATKETYLKSQPLLMNAMRKRINEIFGT